MTARLTAYTTTASPWLTVVNVKLTRKKTQLSLYNETEQKEDCKSDGIYNETDQKEDCKADDIYNETDTVERRVPD